MKIAESLICRELKWNGFQFQVSDSVVRTDSDFCESENLVYVWVSNSEELASYFGSTRDGKIFVSNIKWSSDPELNQKLYDLIDNGLTSYQALEFLEL
jgi:hypothetical protein